MRGFRIVPDESTARPASPRVALTILAALALAGCSHPSPSHPPPTTNLRLGETATLRDDAGNTVDVTIADATARTACDGSFVHITNEPNVYATITATVVHGSWTLDPANFGLTDQPWPAGSLHSGSTGECETDLHAGTLQAGDSVHGHLVLLGGRDQLPHQIAYASGRGTPAASWKWR